MHEFSLITDLMRKIDVIAREQGARRVVGVKVRLGAVSSRNICECELIVQK